MIGGIVNKFNSKVVAPILITGATFGCTGQTDKAKTPGDNKEPQKTLKDNSPKPKQEESLDYNQGVFEASIALQRTMEKDEILYSDELNKINAMLKAKGLGVKVIPCLGDDDTSNGWEVIYNGSRDSFDDKERQGFLIDIDTATKPSDGILNRKIINGKLIEEEVLSFNNGNIFLDSPDLSNTKVGLSPYELLYELHNMKKVCTEKFAINYGQKSTDPNFDLYWGIDSYLKNLHQNVLNGSQKQTYIKKLTEELDNPKLNQRARDNKNKILKILDETAKAIFARTPQDNSWEEDDSFKELKADYLRDQRVKLADLIFEDFKAPAKKKAKAAKASSRASSSRKIKVKVRHFPGDIRKEGRDYFIDLNANTIKLLASKTMPNHKVDMKRFKYTLKAEILGSRSKRFSGKLSFYAVDQHAPSSYSQELGTYTRSRTKKGRIKYSMDLPGLGADTAVAVQQILKSARPN